MTFDVKKKKKKLHLAFSSLRLAFREGITSSQGRRRLCLIRLAD